MGLNHCHLPVGLGVRGGRVVTLLLKGSGDLIRTAKLPTLDLGHSNRKVKGSFEG